jgi:hypothetical protein
MIIKADQSCSICRIYFKNLGKPIEESEPLCMIIPIESPFYMDIIIINEKLDIPSYTVEDRYQGFIYHLRGTLDKTYFKMKGKNIPKTRYDCYRRIDNKDDFEEICESFLLTLAFKDYLADEKR